ncbi:MAG: dynamin family protein, partial [Akkermansia sp.]
NKYKQYRDQVVAFIKSTISPLSQAALLSNGSVSDLANSISNKIELDRFTLVLVGAFQSGKSTLFNYLCDGRELSPIGPGGGGIRTSGCQVSAHPVSEGEQERAEITWRSKEDLFQSIAGEITYRIADLDLDQKDDCQKMGDLAWEWLCENGNMMKDEERELLRFAMILSRFYNSFQKERQTIKTTCTPEEASCYSSYPQDWERRWQQVMEEGNQDLSLFSSDDVRFAFVGYIDLFLDSAILRTLGCTIIDSPGLFVSKWDTNIATKCIQRADAVLYLFAGDKAMKQDDLQALGACVSLGATPKLIFGANLRTSKKNWVRIRENNILPKLKEIGFESASVNDFHSAIALRTRELCNIGKDALSRESERAIDVDIHLSTSATEINLSDRVKYLKKMLKRFIASFSDDDKELSDFGDSIDYNKLEDFSEVPAFIRVTNDYVIKNKFYSLLIRQGLDVILNDLTTQKTILTSIVEDRKKSVEEKQKELEEQERILCSFEKERDLSIHAITNQFQLSKNDLISFYCDLIDQQLNDRRQEIIKFVDQNRAKSSIRERFFADLNRCKKLENGLADILNNILDNVGKNLRETFSGKASYISAKDIFFGERGRVLKSSEQLQYVSPLLPDQMSFPEDIEIDKYWQGRVQEDLRSTIAKDKEDTKKHIWLEIFTCGLSRLFDDDWARATSIVDQYFDSWKKAMEMGFTSEMEQNIFIHWDDALNKFRQALDQPRELYEVRKKSAQQELENSVEANNELQTKIEKQNEELGLLIEKGTQMKD